METQNNNPAPIQYYNNSGSDDWWKILLGLAAGAGAWYWYENYYKKPEIPAIIPDDTPSFNENLEVLLWENYFLSQGTDGWPNAIMAEALKNSGNLETLFRAQLQHSSDQKYVSDGATSGAYRTSAMRAVQVRVMQIKRVPSWVEKVRSQAVERGISYEAMLEINAIWGIVEEKIIAYLVRYKAAHGITGGQQGGGQQSGGGGGYDPCDYYDPGENGCAGVGVTGFKGTAII